MNLCKPCKDAWEKKLQNFVFCGVFFVVFFFTFISWVLFYFSIMAMVISLLDIFRDLRILCWFPSFKSKGALEFLKGNTDLMDLFLITDSVIKPWLGKCRGCLAWLFVVHLVALITKGDSKGRLLWQCVQCPTTCKSALAYWDTAVFSTCLF